MTTNIYTPSHVKFSTSDTIAGIQNLNDDRGIQELVQGSDGNVLNTWIGSLLESPIIGITTTEIKAALDAVSLSGRVIDGDDTLTVWVALMDANTGARKTGASHISLVINQGRLIPRILSVDSNQPATQLLDAIATYDGTNKPLVVTDSQTITGSSGGVTGIMYTLGPVTFNGTPQVNLLRMSFDPGIELLIQDGDGQGYSLEATIIRRQPRFTLGFEDAAIWAAMDGLKAQPTIAIYLRKMLQNGVRVADATAEHIKFTIPLAASIPRAISSAHGAQSSFDIEIIPYIDGSAIDMEISTASAIT